MNNTVKPLDYKKLGTTIRSVFIDSDEYKFVKSVPTFEIDGKFLGDFFDFVMLEPRTTEPPIFYHTYSPFDVISRKSSDYGAVFQAAELLFSGETTPYVYQRTGVMSALVMQSLGVDKLKDKKVLFVGTGKVARCALAALRVYYPELAQVDFINAGSDATAFRSLAMELGIEARRGEVKKIGSYDIIICHAAAKQPVLTKEMLLQIKSGAFIGTFAGEDHMEITEDYYDHALANIIIDWQQTATEAVELKAALENGRTNENDLLCLKDIFAGTKTINDTKQFIIYRSHGTPMQNLAFLKLLMKN